MARPGARPLAAAVSEGPRRLPRPAPATLGIAAVVLFWLSLYFYVPVLPVQASRLGAGVAGVGLVLAAYGFVQFLLRVPTGLWSDRLGRRQPFLVGSLAAAAIAAAVMAAAPAPLELGLGRAVSGLAACGWVATTLLIADLLPAAGLGGALAIAGFVSQGGQLVGTFAGGAIAQAGGLRAPFWAAAAAGVLGALIALAVREPSAGTARPAGGLAARLAAGGDRHLLSVSGLALGAQCVTFVTTYGFLPLVAATRFHAGGLDLGLLAVAAGAPAALAALAAGRLGRRHAPWRLAGLGFAVAAAGAAAIPLAPNLVALAGSAVAIGAGLGLNQPLLMTQAVQGFAPARRGTAMGFYQSIYSIGMFGGPAVAGAVGAHWGLTALFEGTAAVAVLAALLCRPVLLRPRSAGT